MNGSCLPSTHKSLALAGDVDRRDVSRYPEAETQPRDRQGLPRRHDHDHRRQAAADPGHIRLLAAQRRTNVTGAVMLVATPEQVCWRPLASPACGFIPLDVIACSLA